MAGEPKEQVRRATPPNSDRRAPGVEILGVEARTGRVLSPGAVYTVLDRLEAKGLVASEVTASTPARGGRRMRRYWMEPAGARALRDVYAGMRRMAQGLGPKLDGLAAAGGAAWPTRL